MLYCIYVHAVAVSVSDVHLEPFKVEGAPLSHMGEAIMVAPYEQDVC
jgi:hypothetical protein